MMCRDTALRTGTGRGGGGLGHRTYLVLLRHTLALLVVVHQNCDLGPHPLKRHLPVTAHART